MAMRMCENNLGLKSFCNSCTICIAQNTKLNVVMTITGWGLQIVAIAHFLIKRT